MSNETDLDFQNRTFAYIGEQTVHYSLVVLRETFVVAAVVCFVAIVPALFFAHRSVQHGAHTHDDTPKTVQI